jgi:pimeloyl-ACP methyl ester carboxylesterase
MQGPNSVRSVTFRAADGVLLVGDVAGDPSRPTVVLMHGGGQTRHSWSGAMQVLMAEGYHVINFDARGHGESGWSQDGLYPLKVRAIDDLGSVLAGVKGPLGLVGASMGGATALTAIGEGVQPEATVLVMVDMVPRPDARGPARVLAFMKSHSEGFATLAEAAEAVAAYNPHRPRPKDITGLLRNLRHMKNGRYYWHWDPRMLDDGSGLEPGEWGERLITYCCRVRIPTLLVRGMASDVVTDAGTEEFKRLIPSLETFKVPGAGHMVAGDRNDIFNEGVIEFLKRHMPPVGLEERRHRSDAPP